jgi:uncharacterized protein YggE
MEKIKSILFTVLSIFILILGYAVISYVETYSKSIEPGAYRSFSVSAEGTVTALPDIAQFNLSIISEGSDLLKIQKENTEKANKAIEFLKQKGIDSKDIKTQNYNISPKYTYYSCNDPVIYTPQLGGGASKPEIQTTKPCPPPKISGYTINQTINVKIRDFSKIGDILSGIVEYGANNVSSLSFSIDNPEKLQEQAREEAILKAKEKALSIAKASGFKLGNLLSIDEGLNYYPAKSYSLGMGGAEMNLSAPAPTIEPGSQEIKINVTLRYEIK